MFNEKQKIRYINQSNLPENSIVVLKKIFNGVAKIEAQNDLDLSNFNRPQVVDLLKSYNSRARSYLKLVCKYFSDYYSWCLSEKLVDITNVTNWYHTSLSNSIIDEVIPLELIRDKFYTEDDVLGYLENIPDPVNKFVVYGLFRGIRGENYCDLSHLRMENLHEKRKAVELEDGRMHPVDDLFMELMKNADKATIYAPDGIVATNGLNRSRNEYDKSVYVFKGCRTGYENRPVENQFFTVRMCLIKKQTKNPLISATTLYNNGLINFIKEHYEPKGIPLKDVLFKNKDNNRKFYMYDEETQAVINEFGSYMTVRMLRLQMREIIQYYE
jgi:hypothetical protein